MKRLDEIFDIWYGVNLELIRCDEENGEIPFVSRTSANNGVVSYVKRIDNITPNPAGTISVACSGSVLSTFFQSKEYYSGRDVYILKPKFSLSQSEMLYYCSVIEMNKYRYNYGRAANKTLRKILVPTPYTLPSWIKNDNVLHKFKDSKISDFKYELKVDKWKFFTISQIFTLSKCKCSNATELLEDGNDIAYIGAKKSDNGIMRFVQNIEHLITCGNCIVFIGDGQGSVGYCTYQPVDFIGSTTLTAGYNLNLNKFNAQFLITILDLERYRYSFGRKYGHSVVKDSKIKLPVTDLGQPDWQFMEDYIKSLPYSRNL